MSDIIYEAAKSFQKLMQCEYMLVFGYKMKNTEILLGFDKHNFYHLCGLHKLKDIFNSKQNHNDVFQNIIKRKITDNYLANSKFYIEENVEDRINRVANLANLLEKTLCQPGAYEVYKFERNANPESNIKGNFLIKYAASDQRTVYFVICKDYNNPDKYFGLSIFSRDLSDTKQNDFAKGHTHNTLLYVSKTPLTKNKKLDIAKEDVLYKLSSYPGLSSGGVNIVKFTSPLPNAYGENVLTAHPQTFGQAVREVLKGAAGKVKEAFNRLFRKSDHDTTDSDDTNHGSGNPPAVSAQEQEETASLKSEAHELRDEKAQAPEQEQKPLVKIAAQTVKSEDRIDVQANARAFYERKALRDANPPRTLSQKMEDARKRVAEKNAARSPRPANTDRNHKHK